MKGLIEKRTKLMADLQAIISQCNTEKRDMTPEEQTQFDGMTADVDKLDATIERQKKFDGLNERAAQPTSKPVTQSTTLEPKNEDRAAFVQYLRNGDTRAMTVGTNADGGFLAPVDFAQELVKIVIEKSPIRGLSTVIETNLKSVPVPRKSSGPTAAWVAEGGPASSTQSVYGSVTIPVNMARTYVDVSRELLNDSSFNFEQLITADLADEFARLEGAAFVAGNVAGKPSGVLDTATNGITYMPTGVANTISADNLIDLLYSLKFDYVKNATWMFNRSTLRTIRKLKANGEYIWNPMSTGQNNNIVGGLASTILDRPFIVAPDMPSSGATAMTVAVGDFKAGYRIVVQPATQALAILRDEYTQAANGLVRFHGFYRVGGSVVLPEAFAILKEAVS